VSYGFSEMSIPWHDAVEIVTRDLFGTLEGDVKGKDIGETEYGQLGVERLTNASGQQKIQRGKFRRICCVPNCLSNEITATLFRLPCVVNEKHGRKIINERNYYR